VTELRCIGWYTSKIGWYAGYRQLVTHPPRFNDVVKAVEKRIKVEAILK